MGYRGKEKISQSALSVPTDCGTMKVLLVDDHVLFREGLTSLLDSQPDLSVIGSAKTAAEAIHKTRVLQPDLVLMDFDLPDGTGLDVTQTILNDHPHTKIIFLTLHEDDEQLFEAIRYGAKGYLLKNVSVTRLLSYLRENGSKRTTHSQLMTKSSKN